MNISAPPHIEVTLGADYVDDEGKGRREYQRMILSDCIVAVADTPFVGNTCCTLMLRDIDSMSYLEPLVVNNSYDDVMKRWRESYLAAEQGGG